MGCVEGDRVRVTRGKLVVEGVLLPTEARGTVVVKLDSGYNAGFDAKKIVLKKLPGKRTALEKFESKKFIPAEGLEELALVAAGGTIASRLDYATGGAKMVLTPGELFAAVPELEGVASFKVSRPFTLASEDETPREWVTLAREVGKALNAGARGAIVAHGTDTLGYASAALSFMLSAGKPVAMVGAQRSPDRASFDGALNLLCGARYALGPFGEVAAVMHATPSDDYCFAHRGTKVRKMHSTRRDAFKSVNAEPLARVYPDGRIEKINESAKAREDGECRVRAVFEDKTGLLKAYPGAPPEQLDWFVDRGYKGVLVEAYALGHLPTQTLDPKKSWLKAMERAKEEGVVVAFATQCLYGRVNPFVYANLRKMSERGAVYCSDLLPETAFVKLGWLLGGLKDADEVRAGLLKDYAGEFNPRLTEADFY
ncbi:MAG: Glu-tRNA(Gln) amidotransferase subunit GatD [Candidatus Micrarchaeia archaeon]